MNQVLDPTLSPEFYGKVIEQTAAHFEDTVRLIMQNLWPKGYTVGQEPEPNKMVELLGLIAEHDRNLEVAVNAPFAGDQARAQQALFREDELKKELFAQHAFGGGPA